MGVRSTMDITRESAISQLRNVKLNTLTNEQLGELLEVLNPFDNYNFVDSPPDSARIGDSYGN